MEQGRNKRSRVVLAFAFGVLLLAGALGAAMWRSSAGAYAASSAATGFLAAIDAYRGDAAKLAPEAAARRWLELYDQAAKLEHERLDDLSNSLDPNTGDIVSRRSLFAALPPVAVWPALRAEVERRAASGAPGRDALGLRYFTALLTNDRDAATQTLAVLEKLSASPAVGEDDDLRAAVLEARTLLADIYGTTEERIAALLQSLRTPEEYRWVPIPDLVGMVGEARAAKLLEDVIASPRQLYVHGGGATQALLRRLALAKLDSMRIPQWGLAQSIDGAALYEALEARFQTADPPGRISGDDYAKQRATAYYFLAMVKAGRHAQAEKALREMSQKDDVSIPREAVTALQRAGLNEPLYRFLEDLLANQPAIKAWDVYIEQAAYTGHSADALALVERVLERADLSAPLAADLRIRRIAALLAADRVDAAAETWRVVLASPPAPAEAGLERRFAAAVRAATVGRLAAREDLRSAGVDFALRAARIRIEQGDSISELQGLIAELRRQGLGREAQALVEQILARAPSFTDALAARSKGVAGNQNAAALTELVSIYSHADRHGEALKLLAESPRWGADDLGALLAQEDSQGEPLGAIVARSLAATGDTQGALRVARATVAALPGRDAAYEVVAKLEPDAAATFGSWYERDQFEERPLIWQAGALLEKRNLDEAEAVVRRAIAVDPSDGEEGPNDRMRAYAILAEILKRKGDADDARTFTGAVAAIRMSEHADQLFHAGLYQRAFQEYRDALGKFSDAYCIQSRLAVQLSRQGRQREALEHYRRAYELMPDSFGRVESHCFGCESVFANAESQTLAERVFTEVIRKTPGKAQAHYLLAYLREQQGNYAGAVQPLRVAVGIDGSYLNAWKRLNEIGDKTYLDAGERDIARLKLLELDPLRRHSSYELKEVGHLAQLWLGAARAWDKWTADAPPRTGVLPLTASAAVRRGTRAAASPATRQQEMFMENLERRYGVPASAQLPQSVLFEHVLVDNTMKLLGAGAPLDDY